MIIGGLLVTLDDRRILIDGANALRLAVTGRSAVIFSAISFPNWRP
jgi:hypothetical protein